MFGLTDNTNVPSTIPNFADSVLSISSGVSLMAWPEKSAEERRLVEEEGSLSKKTWLLKKEDEAG